MAKAVAKAAPAMPQVNTNPSAALLVGVDEAAVPVPVKLVLELTDVVL
jgi:hypothetical protein